MPFFAAIAPISSGRLWQVYQGAWRLQTTRRALLAAARPTLDSTTAEPAREPPEPPPMVAKYSVMVGVQLVSSRRLLGRPGPKSGSAGSSWRPQHTRKSCAARAMALVLQDKPRHSTDLAELCSPILWSALFPFRACLRAKGRRGTRKGWGDPLNTYPDDAN